MNTQEANDFFILGFTTILPKDVPNEQKEKLLELLKKYDLA